jgi:hypothetical protein
MKIDSCGNFTFPSKSKDMNLMAPLQTFLDDAHEVPLLPAIGKIGVNQESKFHHLALQ